MEAPLCGGRVSICEVLSKFPFLYYSGAKATAPKETAALGRGSSVQSWSHSIPGRDHRLCGTGCVPMVNGNFSKMRT